MAGELLQPTPSEIAGPPRKADNRGKKHLTDAQKSRILRLAREGLTQVVIAQQIGCSQSAVSLWLDQCSDSTDDAKSYLRGQALRMAQSIVKKGQPSVHAVALKGLSVLEEERSSGLVIQIGVKDSDVSITLAPALSPSETIEARRKPTETLRISAGSDNPSSVNQP